MTPPENVQVPQRIVRANRLIRTSRIVILVGFCSGGWPQRSRSLLG